jgi:hypothetical protein
MSPKVLLRMAGCLVAAYASYRVLLALTFSGGQCWGLPTKNFYTCENGLCALKGEIWDEVHSYYYCNNYVVVSPLDVPAPFLSATLGDVGSHITGTFKVEIPWGCYDHRSRIFSPKGSWATQCSKGTLTKLAAESDEKLIESELSAARRSMLLGRYLPVGLLFALFVAVDLGRSSQKRKRAPR